MKQAYVIGLGKSGIAAARLLQEQGWAVTVSDRNTSETLHPLKAQLEAAGITVLLGHAITPDPEHMQRIVVSPGVPWDLPVLVQARALGIETLGEMELAWRSLSDSPWVAITGTNGKTTVTSLIAAIFQAAGLNAPSCGNIGNAASELALNVQMSGNAQPDRSLDWVVAEVSSYQSEAASTLSPQIAIWTTFTPDHLSRHKTLEKYYAIKARLLNQAKVQILNGDDPHLRATGGDRWPHAVWTSTLGKASLPNPSGSGAYIENGWVYFTSGQDQSSLEPGADERIVAVKDLRMVGDHNQQNLLMAVAAARIAGAKTEAIAQAIQAFPGVPHRLEHICCWHGIEFINDSKATNYDAAEVGLRAMQGSAILIAGGEAKAGDDTAWIEQIRNRAAAVVLMGAAADAFAQRLKDSGYDAWVKVDTMDEAVFQAAKLAQQLDTPTVLLSPACASFDQYPNFEARGDHFRQLCQAMVPTESPTSSA
ncbi:MAG: UDP-N-acetylmuramoyl-L-alanine--D-glutamate ligase [Elainellaceae cyanobacterium]